MSALRLTVFGCIALTVAGCHRSMAGGEDHSSHTMASGGAVAGTGAVGLPPSGNTAAARMAATPRRGEWIKVPYDPGSRDTIMTWVSYPTNRAKAPVVVVVHDINGMGVWTRGVADQLAAEGFIGVAPDFVSRERGGPPSTVDLTADSARKLTSPLSSTDRNKVISRVAAFVMAMPAAEHKYGVIGFCWGGSTVFMHAVNGGVPGYSGGVGFYGLPYMDGPVAQRDSLAKIKTPVMLFSGAKDARIGAAMPGVDSMMKALGKEYASKNFDGAVHGFMKAQDDPKAQRDVAEEQANMAAVRESWPKTVDFLKRVLR